MQFLIPISLLAWPLVVLAIFAFLPGRQAAATSVVGAWLLLPPAGIGLPGLPDYTKETAAVAGVLLGTLVFDFNRFMNFRPRWIDLPMVLWCLTGIVTSLRNDLGLYDGISSAMGETFRWGMPYFVGRLYFGDPAGLRTLATAMVVGAVWYVPLCYFEMRFMTSIMIKVYGIGQWSSGTGLRMGGYRPNVFFSTGLELGLYMAASSLAAWWLWRCGAIKKFGQIPYGAVLLPILFVTAILCRSTGALALLAMGILLLWLSARYRTRLFLASLLAIGPVYAAARIPRLWSGEGVLDIAAMIVGSERANSVKFRMDCEDLLIARAMQQPLFGWGAFGRSDAHWHVGGGLRRVDTDGMWVIYLGTRGIVGLILLYLALISPAIVFVWRFPARLWTDPRAASGVLAAALLGLYVIDCLLNGFSNIIYVGLAGGLVGLDPRQIGQKAMSRPVPKGAGTDRAALAASAVARGPFQGRLALADRYRSLGRSFKQQGRLDEAETAWQQALDVAASLLEVDPYSAELRQQWCDCANDLVWLRVNHHDPGRRDLNTSVAMARRMVQDFPLAEVYWNTLGVVCYRAGDDAAAVTALDRSTALGGGTAFDDVFLSMAHARLGDLDCARTELARALLRAEQDYSGHRELAVFCDEARSILGHAETPAPSH